MYVRCAFAGIDRISYLLIYFILGLDSLWFHAKVHDRVLRSMKTSGRSALLNSVKFQTKTCQEGTPAEVIDRRKKPQSC
jgi:hypothetical protein